MQVAFRSDLALMSMANHQAIQQQEFAESSYSSNSIMQQGTDHYHAGTIVEQSEAAIGDISALSLHHHNSTETSASSEAGAGVERMGIPEMKPHLKTRRSHKKSRKGCMQCKQRKVKCDEAHPMCGRCSFRGQKCEYPPGVSADPSNEAIDEGHSQTTSPSLTQSTLLHTSSANTVFRRCRPDITHSSPLNLSDLELFNHFIHHTAPITSPRLTNALNLHNESTTHAMLALSALCAYHDSVDKRSTDAQSHIRLAEQHHDAALSRMRTSNDQLSAAPFLLPFAFAYGTPWIPLCRSLNVDIGEDNDASAHALYPTVVATWSSAYETLRTLLLTSSHETSVRALDLLANSVDPVLSSRATPVQCLMNWASEVDDDYLELLARNDNGAYVVLAHVHVFMMLAEGLWWISNRGSVEIARIDGMLGDEWRSWLDWPRSMMVVAGEVKRFRR